jgi:hypothetical protein
MVLRNVPTVLVYDADAAAIAFVVESYQFIGLVAVHIGRKYIAGIALQQPFNLIFAGHSLC